MLTAFQNVADALHALDADAAAQMPRAGRKRPPGRAWRCHTVSWNSAPCAYLALLNAEQTYQQAVVALAQARANRYSDTAALFQALGGRIDPGGIGAAHPPTPR